jgi:phosphate starvation-inducible protein PhoH
MGRDDAYEILKKVGTIQFESTSYERGNTHDNTIMIIDEAQNCTAHELDTLITRVGKRSRLIICGDLFQQDLTKHSDKNVYKVLDILKTMPQFIFTHFNLEDIVRSGLVREYLMAKYAKHPTGF